MEKYDFVINGLPIPPLLVAAIRHGKWRPPSDPGLIRAVFGETEPESPQFYDLASMVPQNRRLPERSVRQVYGEVVEGTSVGLNPRKAVYIGDLGIDKPIALDYRRSLDDPRVLYLGQTGWVEVAESVHVLLRKLDLSN
ncbi:SMI1/KNR4 family protein [Dactylosporangium sp. CA-092794]|uniref:SMI1/KNR4 family protein n=1 Tax=Dactylosporangium sp. CA-092794 TaxID=3239929 RepID=UPI003D8B3E39